MQVLEAYHLMTGNQVARLPFLESQRAPIWNRVDAEFHQQSLPYISALPALVTISAILIEAIWARIQLSSQWTRPFVQEMPKAFVGDASVVRRKLSPTAMGLLALTTIGIALRAISISYHPAEYLPATLIIPWAAILFLTLICRPAAVPMSFLAICCSILIAESILLLHLKSPPMARVIPLSLEVLAAVCAIVLLVNMPFQSSDPPSDSICSVFETPSHLRRSPEDNLKVWQFMTVSWMNPLISLGRIRQLNDSDVWGLGFEFQHRELHSRFRELHGTVVRRLLKANGLDLMTTGFLGMVEMIANYAVPLLLQQLLQSLENHDSPLRAAVTYAVLSLLARLIASQSAVFSVWFSRRCYERSRGEMITMLYEKTLMRKVIGNKPGLEDSPLTEVHPRRDINMLKMNSIAFLSSPIFSIKTRLRWLPTLFWTAQPNEDTKAPASMGKILNLMRNDVYEVAQRFWEFSSLITNPLGLVVSIVLIYRIMGWSCLIGLLVVLIAQAANALIVRSLLRWETKRRKATDIKLQAISEFVQAIRHLRWYSWEGPWLNEILDKRQQELRLRVLTGFGTLLVSSINLLASGMFPVIAFYAYTYLAGQPLRIDVAFPALQLFSMLEQNVREIPNLITVLLNASIAVRRIEDFMAEPNQTSDTVFDLSTTRLELKNASFAFPGTQRPILLKVSLTFPVGLTVIYGVVGSGKSALLLACLGELDLLGGELTQCNEAIGYCAQSPWLQSMSIRDNILFHTTYEESRYRQVIEACALTFDLAGFKYGDASMIGENGVGLSGGQRARIALARAVYSRAKTLILDDPLSALDHPTAQMIVHHCLQGPLVNDRVIILVTHRTDLAIHIATQVIEISDHKAKIQYSDFDKSKQAFPKIQAVGKTIAVTAEETELISPKLMSTDDNKFIEDEHRVHGGVQARVYWEYIKAGQLKWWSLVVLTLLIFRLFAIGLTWFLKQWGEAYSSDTSKKAGVAQGLFDKFPSPQNNVKPWLVGFFLITAARTLAFLASQAVMLVIIYHAGRQMFRAIMNNVTHATFRFYDVTPVGRLMNRLTSDVGTVDGNISQQFQNVAWYSLTFFTSLVVIAASTPVFLLFSLFQTVAFVLIFLYFLPASQSLRRLEMVSLSPLMSNFGALLDGLATVRAFRAQAMFQDRVITVTDAFQKMDHFYWSLQAWLMYRFDNLAACSTFLLTLIAILTSVSPGLTAFVLNAAYSLVTATHLLCKQYGQLQMDFVSVERVVELLDLEQEPSGDVSPPASWPTFTGDIIFDDVTVKYAPKLDPALKNVSLKIRGGSNVAIVGRTGSGKSTLALSLIATMAPVSGSITIDGIDIAKVNKEALRRRITFLAQDPVLFPGTMRQNLDPLGEYCEQDCSRVLEKIGVDFHWTLASLVETGGKNLSQGQRQLIGLARAILRRSPIVIFDEATASIDRETAAQIQHILKEELTGSTIVTIAHKVEAVQMAERFVILAKGKVTAEGNINCH